MINLILKTEALPTTAVTCLPVSLIFQKRKLLHKCGRTGAFSTYQSESQVSNFGSW